MSLGELGWGALPSASDGEAQVLETPVCLVWIRPGSAALHHDPVSQFLSLLPTHDREEHLLSAPISPPSLALHLHIYNPLSKEAEHMGSFFLFSAIKQIAIYRNSKQITNASVTIV